MSRNRRVVGAVLALLAVALGGCGDGPRYSSAPAPATVERGADGVRVRFSASAARRVGLRTAVVTDNTVPYAAVLYDPDGKEFVYASATPLLFVRHAIEIDHVESDRAVLVTPLAPGTRVVTVGAAEVFGAEFGVGEE